MPLPTLTPEDLNSANRRVRRYLEPAPLVRSPFLSEVSGADVWLKLESLQPTGSFKVRGAINRLSTMRATTLARGVVTASAGNHGLGVAFAGQALGLEKVTVFVPQTCPTAKLQKLKTFSVDLRMAGLTYEDAHLAAAAFASETGAVEVAAYDDLQVIAGQATIATEVFSRLSQVDWLFVPVGGGGMIAGISYAAAQTGLSPRIVGVQPSASPAALLSLRDGMAYDPFEHGPTIADGLAGGFGQLPLAMIAGNVEAIALASEEELRLAVYSLVSQQQIIAEPSGAISIVPLLRSEFNLTGKTVVCVISGGNLSTELLREILDQHATG